MLLVQHTASFVSRAVYSDKDHHNSPNYWPLLKNTCVRQVVSDSRQVPRRRRGPLRCAAPRRATPAWHGIAVRFVAHVLTHVCARRRARIHVCVQFYAHAHCCVRPYVCPESSYVYNNCIYITNAYLCIRCANQLYLHY